MSVIEIDSFREFDLIAANNERVYVKFYATWCGPCRGLAPFYERAANSSDRPFVAVDIDKPGNADLVQRFSVQQVPTVLVLDTDGERRLDSKNPQALLKQLGD